MFKRYILLLSVASYIFFVFSACSTVGQDRRIEPALEIQDTESMVFGNIDLSDTTPLKRNGKLVLNKKYWFPGLIGPKEATMTIDGMGIKKEILFSLLPTKKMFFSIKLVAGTYDVSIYHPGFKHKISFSLALTNTEGKSVYIGDLFFSTRFAAPLFIDNFEEAARELRKMNPGFTGSFVKRIGGGELLFQIPSQSSN